MERRGLMGPRRPSDVAPLRGEDVQEAPEGRADGAGEVDPGDREDAHAPPRGELGIAEGVVDLRSRVAGAPLDLEVREEVAAVSLRLVVGRAAHALLADELVALLERLRPSLEG